MRFVHRGARMPRPERPVDATAGPVQAFAQELRDLREAAGTPKYLQMARTTGRSRTSLSEAAGGDHLPSWDTVEAFVRYCGGDTLAWRAKWEEVRDKTKSPDRRLVDDRETPEEPASPTQPPEPATTIDDDTEPPRSRTSRRHIYWIATASQIPLIAILVAYLVGQDGGDQGQVEAQPPSATITVHNKVAIGASVLIEDSTPAYLSTRPVGRCTSRGCRIAETDMWSGAQIVARCWVRGETLTNQDLTSPDIDKNEGGVTSDLWYEIILHTGTVGYLSEVYVSPSNRGGMDLPECRTQTP